MQFRHFVVGQVVAPRSGGAAGPRGAPPWPAARHLDPNEEVRLGGVGVAVVELGHVAVAEQRAELAKAAGTLGYRHGEDGFALLAQFRPLGDEAQAVEVHVGAAGDGHERASAHAMPRAPRLDAGNASAPAGSRIERVSSNTSLMAAHVASVSTRDHLVDIPARQPEGLAADLLDRHAVGEEPHVRQRRPACRRQASASWRRNRRAATPMILTSGRTRLMYAAMPRDEPAAADRDEDRIERVLALAQDLHADRALSRDHVRDRRTDARTSRRSCFCSALRFVVRIGVRIAVQDHLGAARLHRGGS